MNMAAKGLTHFLLFWLFVAGVVGLFYRQEISEWVIDVAGDSEIVAYLKDDTADDARVEKAVEPAAEEAETPAQAEPAPQPQPEAPAPAVTESAVAPQQPQPEPTPAAEPDPQTAAAQPTEHASEPAAEPAVEADAQAAAEPATDETAEPAAEPVAEPETAGAAEDTAPAPAEETAPASVEETASAPAEEPAVLSETAAVPAPTPAAPTPVTPMPAFPAPMQAAPAPMPAAPVPPQAMAPGVGLSPELVRDWSQARDLYWRGDLAKAEEAYLALVRDHADEPDVAGELANLLLQIGKPEDAAGFYLEAGLRMLRGPMPGRAGMVVGILDGLAPDKAELLRKKLMEKMHPPAGTSN